MDGANLSQMDIKVSVVGLKVYLQKKVFSISGIVLNISLIKKMKSEKK